MSRRQKTPFAAWESTKPTGIEKRYIRTTDTMMSHAAYRALGDKAWRLYEHMKMESGGKREFTLPYSKIMKIMPISKQGIHAAITELEIVGFVDVVENNANLRKPNLYRFSDRWKQYKAAEKDFWLSTK